MKAQVLENWKTLLVEEHERQGAGAMPTFFLTENRSHIVFGVSFRRNQRHGRNGIFFEILDDHGNLVSAPDLLFKIVNALVPSCWIARNGVDGLYLWPELFYTKHFFDDLSEREPGIFAKFQELRSEFE